MQSVNAEPCSGAYLYGVNDLGQIVEYNPALNSSSVIRETGCVTASGTGNPQANAFAYDRDRDQMMWVYQSGRPTDPPSGLWYWDRGTGSISRFALPCALLMDWSAFGNYTNCGGDYMIKKVPDSAVFYQDAFWFIPSRRIYNNYPRCSLVKVPITYTAGQPTGTGQPLVYDVSGGDCPGPTSGLVFGDIAIQPQTNLLYGVTATPSGEVFKVDLSTLKLVGQGTSDWQLILAPGTDKGVQIAFDASYTTLYGVTAGNAPGGGVWYTIDLNTGVEKATGWTSSPGPRDIGGAACLGATPTPLLNKTASMQSPRPFINKTASPSTVVPGESFNYTVTVLNGNSASVDMTNSIVTDPMPAGITAKAVNNPGCSIGAVGASVTCNFGTMKPGASNTFVVTAVAESAQSYINFATLAYSAHNRTQLPLRANATVTVQTPKPPTFTKTASKATLVPGESFNFTVTVTNQAVTAIGNSAVTDPMPIGITATAVDNPACTLGSGGASVTCSFGTVAAGASRTAIITAVASAAGTYSNTASLTYTVGGVRQPPLNSTATVTVQTPKPPTFTKTASKATLVPGESFNFTVTVTNPAVTAIANSAVTDPMPTGITATAVDNPACTLGSGGASVTCSFGTVAAGASRTAIITAVASAAGTYSNTASLTYTVGGVRQPPLNSTATVTVQTPKPPTFTKTASKATLVPGESFNFTVTVTNQAVTAIGNSAVTDPMPTGITATAVDNPACTLGSGGASVTCSFGTVAAGASRTAIITAVASAAGTYSNTASLTYTVGGVRQPPLNSTATVTVQTPKPPTFTKTASKATLVPGESFNFTVTVTNQAVTAIANSAVTDPMPTGITATAVDNPACTLGSGGASVTCSFGTVAAGASRTAIITAVASAAGTYSNTASLTYTVGGVRQPPLNSTTTVTVQTPKPPTFTKTASKATLVPGESFNFTVTVTNQAVTAIGNSAVTDPMPTGITATAVDNPACTLGSGGASVTCSFGTVAAGASRTAIITAVASAAGTYSNTASLTYTVGGVRQPPLNSTATVTVQTPKPPTFTKTASKATLVPGESFNFTVTVTNPAVTAIANSAVTDPMPTGITATAVDNPACTLGSGGASVTCSFGTVAAGASRTAIITAVASAAGTYSNTASLTYTVGGVRQPPLNSTATVTVQTPKTPTFTKTASKATLVPGESFNFTVTVTNQAVTAIGNSAVTDPMPTGITATAVDNPACTLGSGGASVTCSFGTVAAGASRTAIITAVASAAGTYSNTASLTYTVGGVRQPPLNSTATVTVQTPKTPTFTKTASKATLVPGESFNFTVTVTNQAVTAIANSAVTDPMPTGITATAVDNPACTLGSGGASVTCSFGTVTAGASRTAIITAVASAAGTYSNTASLTYTVGGVRQPPLNSTTTVTVQTPKTPTFTKTASKATLVPGESFNFTVTVTNQAVTAIGNSAVTDPMPTGITATAVDNPACTLGSGGASVTCSFGTVAAGASRTAIITAVASAAGTYSNTASLTYTVGGVRQPPLNSTATVTVQTPKPPTFTKTASKATLVPGESFNFTVTVTNPAVTAIANSAVTDPMPTGITATAVDNPACTLGSGGASVTCSFGTVAAGASRTAIITAVASAAGTYSNTASLTYTVGGVRQPPLNSTATVTVQTPKTPTFTKTASKATLVPGESFNFTVTVTNQAVTAIANSAVTDPMPTGITATAVDNPACTLGSGGASVTCSFGTVTAGASRTAIITAVASAAGTYSNTASLTYTVGGVRQPPLNSTATVTVQTPKPPTFTKTASKATLVPGESFNFTVTVTNPAVTAIANSAVTDPMPTGITATAVDNPACTLGSGGASVTCSFGTVAAGASRTAIITAVASAAGTYSNTASLTYTVGGVRQPPLNSTATVTVQTPKTPTFTKTASKATLVPGESFNFTVTVTNQAVTAIANSAVTDPMPTGITATAVDNPACTLGSGGASVTCSFGTVTAGASRTAIITAVASAAGTYSNTASLTYTVGGVRQPPLNSTATVTVQTPKTPTFTKTASKATLVPGESFNFTVTVTNQAVTAIANSVVTDPMPTGITATAVDNPACTLGSGGASVTCSFGTVAAGASRTAIITAVASAAGTYSNTASLTYTVGGVRQPPLNSTATVTVQTPKPPTFTKTASKATLVPGESFNFTVTVTNQAVTAIANSAVTDPMPTGITATAVDNPACTLGSGGASVTCSFGTVAAGASRTAIITAVASAAGTYNNTASLTYTVGGVRQPPLNSTATVTVQSCEGLWRPCSPCIILVCLWGRALCLERLVATVLEAKHVAMDWYVSGIGQPM
ncbi:hypothetical protein OEZ85_010070 [Tetradesmus obliquus]|uniref:DUF11 domain-containing protein n=1 Tax=Tetradesmus obliquus TaxID=3088 RepID=A0ABY8TPZ6_TETOB|nr:hypothetical protein OEZ85_010070 [Tetradesmus obliquus]